MIEVTQTDTPDSVDFAWWDDDSLINFSLDYDRVKALDVDTLHDLVWELAQRLNRVVPVED